MTDQKNRTHWLGPLKISAGASRGVARERDGQIEAKMNNPIAPDADGHRSMSSETEAEGPPS